MRFTAAKRTGPGPEAARLDELARQIGRLLRHPSYRRDRVVSAILRRHLPQQSGYAWQGEDALRKQLERAGLDLASLDHLIGNARSELARLRDPGDA